MITPPYLQKGDTVAILSTARKHINESLQTSISLLKKWGLNVVIGKSIGLDYNQLAGTDEQRAADLQEKLDDPNIKAVWCVRGGYGTVRIIDLLNFDKFKQNPKWIIGFSDITVLHNHLNTIGYQSIHSIMPITLDKSTPEAVDSLRTLLFGESLAYNIEPHHLNKIGKGSGELVGGNLSVIYSLLGSKSAINCTNKILFIEDLDEYLYHIDRMMMNLKRNGCLENLKGLIVGSMTDMKDNSIPWGKDALEIIYETIKDYHFPVIFNFPAGHINNNNALPLGSKFTIEVANDGCSLKF